jgi:hypothetical protein
MNTILIMKRWQASVQSTLTALHTYQRRALALFSFAAATERHCSIARLSAAVPSLAQPPSTRRRLLRLLGNERLDAAAISAACGQLAQWLTRWNAPTTRLLLLLDETPWHNHWRVLKLSVAFRRRAVPLLWIVLPLRARELPMEQIVLALLEQAWGVVQQYVPLAAVVLLADRGLCWPSLIRWCQQRGWDYVLRAQRQTRLRWCDEHGVCSEQALSTLAPEPGTWWCGSGLVFKKAGWLPSNVVCCWTRHAKEAWLLVTSLPPTVQCCRWYRRRLWQEQSFRDEKSHGFNWQLSQVGIRKNDVQRVHRLWLILALAQVWLLSLGHLAQSPAWRQRLGWQGAGTRRRLSYFRQGYTLLKWQLLTPHGVFDDFRIAIQFPPP